MTWPLAVEASSMELILRYVAPGEGIGANIAIPNIIRHPQVRVLPPEGFPRIELTVMWSGPLTPLLRGVLEEIQRHVAQYWPQAKCDDQLPA